MDTTEQNNKSENSNDEIILSVKINSVMISVPQNDYIAYLERKRQLEK